MLCVSIGTWAGPEIWSRTQNGVAGYGLYGFQADEVAAILNGSYEGTIGGNGTVDDLKAAAFVKLGSTNESLSQADIEALSALTNVQYLRMDNCTLSGTVDFSQIGVSSTGLLEVTMPEGVTREQVEAANTKLKSVASGLKLVAGVSGEVEPTVTPHYYYTIPNVGTFEYTDPVAEGQTSITVTDFAIMADLTPVSGYPKNIYINSKNGDKEYEVDDAYVASHTKNVWGADCFVPSPLDVKLTPTNVNFVTVNINGTTYSLPDNTAVTEDNGVYKLSSWTYCEEAGQGINAGTEVTVTPGISYYYKWRENNSEVDKKYTGAVPDPDDDGNYVVALENNYNGNDGYKFEVTTSYLYTYTDKNGNEATYNQYDEDGKIQIDTYSGTLDLTNIPETTYSLVVDGATACVNVAGSLSDALTLFTDSNGDATLTNYKSAKNITIIGEVNNNDLSSLSNFTQPKLVDISDGEFTESGAGSQIATAFNSLAAASKPVVIIPTPEGTAAPTTGSTDEVALQSGSITYAYYIDEEKKKMEAWCPKDALVLQNLEPVVSTDMTLTFLPSYKADGSFSEYMLMYGTTDSSYGFLTSADVLGKLPFGSVDLTWVYYGAAYCDYRYINENTHYIIVPTNSVSAEYDITDESGTKDFKYNNNIWVVATYKGVAEPYATQVYYDGRSLNTAPYSSNNLQGFEAEGTTANITYIRTAGKLSGAENLVSDLQKNADRTVIVGNVAQSDITAINVMRNSVLDLSGAVLQDGADLSTLQNSYIQYLALPYNSTEDVASFKASQCTGLLGVGKFDTANKHLYLQSYQEGGMVTIMSCLAKATGIEYVTAAGEMNARDLAATTNVFDANGHFVFTETANSNVGYTLSVVEGTAQINGAAIQGALNGRLATGFKGLDITGVKLHQYSEEPSNGAGEYFSYDGTYQNDLHMSTLGYVTASTKATLEYLILPVDQSVWRIPTSSMNDSKFDLHTFCIPGQYREIGSNAFNNDNGLFKITTTRVVGGNGSYDDPYEEYEGSLTGAAGGNTITLPPSLTKIESGAFGNVEHFTDVYVTSEEVPVCEKNSFGAGTYYGWGGYRQDQDGMAQRTDYGNESNDLHSKAFGVLHWTQDYSIDDVKKLTDIQRVYFHPDREGKTDDRGNLLHWPTLQQIQRAYALALTGYLDGAWMPYIGGATEPHIDGGTGLLDNVYSAEGNAITQDQADAHYVDYGSPIGETFTDYIGWHQFVLVGSWSYAEKYEYKPWNTICIPYNVTYENLIKMYGVTKSTSENSKKIIVDSEGYPLENSGLDGVDASTGEVATNAETLLPTVSTLTSVNRKVTYQKNKSGVYVLENGVYVKKTAEELKTVDPSNRYVASTGLITLQFTEGMVTKAAEDGKVYNWKVNSDYAWTPGSVSSETGEWEENADNIIMKAGYPYHLKVFVPLGTENIRIYALNELESAGVTATASAPNNEWIVPTTGNAGGDELKYKFKGYYDVSASAVALPMHSYFLWVPKSGESLWYRYEQSWGEAWGQNNPIASYAALIGLIGEDGTWPEYDLMLTDKTSGAQAKGMLVVDFGDGNESEATGISGVQFDAEETGISTGKVYNMNGQVVSESGSLQGLGKGIYIINGKKYIVK